MWRLISPGMSVKNTITLLALASVWSCAVSVGVAADSFQTQLDGAHPGTIIRLSGSHTGKFVTQVKGTAEAPIIIEGDGTAVLVGASPDDPVLNIRHSHYRVRNIEVRGGQVGVEATHAAHGELEGVRVSGTQEAGFEFRRTGTEYWLVKNCSAQHTGLEGRYGEGFYVGDAKGNWLSDKPDTPNHITFLNCYTFDTVNDGWDFKEGAHHIKVVNCTANMKTLAPLPKASLPYDHTGAYCRTEYVQFINFKVENLSEGADLDALGLYLEKGRDEVFYGHHIELKNVQCENIPKGDFVYIQEEDMDVKIYDDCGWKNVGARTRRGSAKGEAIPAAKFVEMQWHGEGGGVCGGLNPPAGADTGSSGLDRQH
jgi:hypothetical protein